MAITYYPSTNTAIPKNGFQKLGERAPTLGRQAGNEIEQVDGFLAALICCSTDIAKSDYLPEIHKSPATFTKFGELNNRRSERAQRLRQAFDKTSVKADIPADIHKAYGRNSDS